MNYFFNVKPKLLAILQYGGSSEQVFTAQQIVALVGKYIEKKKLYDPQNKKIIHFKNDDLGEVFKCEEFVVSENAHKNLWKLISPFLSLSTRRDHAISGQSQLQASSSSQQSNSELPWWYRDSDGMNNVAPSQTTGHDSYNDRATIEMHDSEYAETDVAGENHLDSASETFSEEYEPVDHESDDSDATIPVSSDEDHEYTTSEKVSLQQIESDSEASADDGSDISFDSDIPLEEYWICHECKTRNSPTVGYCMRCWMLRVGWVKNHDSLSRNSSLTRSATDPVPGTSAQSEVPRCASMGVDVADTGRKRTQSKLDEESVESMESDSKKIHLDEPGTSSQDPAKVKSDNGDEPGTSSQNLAPASSGAPAGNNPQESITGLCNICQNRPNNATLVHPHSRIAHQFCCYRCAKRLKKRGKRCPICREPIVLILKNFVYQMW